MRFGELLEHGVPPHAAAGVRWILSAVPIPLVHPKVKNRVTLLRLVGRLAFTPSVAPHQRAPQLMAFMLRCSDPCGAAGMSTIPPTERPAMVQDHWLFGFNYNVEEWFERDRYETLAICRNPGPLAGPGNGGDNSRIAR